MEKRETESLKTMKGRTNKDQRSIKSDMGKYAREKVRSTLLFREERSKIERKRIVREGEHGRREAKRGGGGYKVFDSGLKQSLFLPGLSALSTKLITVQRALFCLVCLFLPTAHPTSPSLTFLSLLLSLPSHLSFSPHFCRMACFTAGTAGLLRPVCQRRARSVSIVVAASRWRGCARCATTGATANALSSRSCADTCVHTDSAVLTDGRYTRSHKISPCHATLCAAPLRATPCHAESIVTAEKVIRFLVLVLSTRFLCLRGHLFPFQMPGTNKLRGPRQCGVCGHRWMDGMGRLSAPVSTSQASEIGADAAAEEKARKKSSRKREGEREREETKRREKAGKQRRRGEEEGDVEPVEKKKKRKERERRIDIVLLNTVTMTPNPKFVGLCRMQRESREAEQREKKVRKKEREREREMPGEYNRE
ncbi:hypothetical protein ALC60_02152 [Trachymyrmex zeteki]|uniref:Uncharacterized protein n=1 Tax=Mycetomoellerius zeteki TaxID=64791 RepID=A0A151XEN8_9HYME|nr:hypothetical protein ALC60_02152 [Trachymyrmex zeteki]